jgi:hypothetical protein
MRNSVTHSPVLRHQHNINQHIVDGSQGNDGTITHTVTAAPTITSTGIAPAGGTNAGK